MKTQTSIQILIDGRSSTPQLSGISRYIIELTKGYAKQYGEKNLTIIVNNPISYLPFKQTICPYKRHGFRDNIKFSIWLSKQNYEIYAATLRERNRIAREIHDNVGHLLSRTILLTGAAKTVNQDKNMESLLEGLDTSLNSAMNSIRSSVHNLHDESETLREITEGIIKDFENCTMEYDMSEIIPNKIKYCFAAIIKEALSNVIKHSNATAVKIVLREHPALYQLCIEDNGKGYSEKEADSKGIGLKNMQERVTSLGGTLQINGKNGFRIFAVIPKQQD